MPFPTKTTQSCYNKILTTLLARAISLKYTESLCVLFYCGYIFIGFMRLFTHILSGCFTGNQMIAPVPLRQAWYI